MTKWLTLPLGLARGGSGVAGVGTVVESALCGGYAGVEHKGLTNEQANL